MPIGQAIGRGDGESKVILRSFNDFNLPTERFMVNRALIMAQLRQSIIFNEQMLSIGYRTLECEARAWHSPLETPEDCKKPD